MMGCHTVRLEAQWQYPGAQGPLPDTLDNLPFGIKHLAWGENLVMVPQSQQLSPQKTASRVEVSVQELMSSVCAARCNDGSEALRLILGNECCNSSIDERI